MRRPDAGRRAARPAWCGSRSPAPPAAADRQLPGAPARRRGRAVGFHAAARLRPARRGAHARVGAAGGRRPVALPRLLVELRARARRCCSPALTKLLGPSLLAWRVLRVAVDALTRAGRLPPRAARRGRALGARRVDRGRRRDGVPDRAGPDAARAAARAVGTARRPRRAGGRRHARGPGIRVPPRGRCARRSRARSSRPARGSRCSRSRSSRRCCWRPSPSSRAATWPARCSGSRAIRASSGCRSSRTGTWAPTRTSCSSCCSRCSSCSPPRSGQRGRCGGGPARRARGRSRRCSPSVVAYLLARADEFHLLPLSAALAAALALAAAAERATAARAVLAVALARDRRPRPRAPRRRGAAPAAPGARPGRGRGRREDAPADAPGAAAGARVRAPPRAAGRPVLVAPPRFDRVRVGDPLLGVLLRRPNPTRYDVMQPGVVTTAEVQREMARDLVRSRTPVVIRWVAPVARASASRTGRRARRACASSTARSPPATGGRRGTATTWCSCAAAGPSGP